MVGRHKISHLFYNNCTKSSNICGIRSYKNLSSSSTPNTNLRIPLFETQASSGTKAKFNPHTKTQVTKLPNGLTVASEDHWGQFATLGVLVNSGSRNEAAFASGVNHFLEKLAFNSTEKFESKEQIFQMLEKHGGICDCQTTRDTMIHAVSLQKEGLEAATELLSQVVLHPKFSAEEVAMTQQIVAFELENLHMSPNKELQMMELIHAAAYKDNTVGLPKLCPPDNIMSLDRDLLFTYLKHQCTPDNMVLAGSGMDHSELVDLANKYFIEKPVWDRMSLSSKYQTDKSYAQYTGGVVALSEDLSNVSLGPTPMPELVHVSIGLESCSHLDDDFVAYCVLNTLMGGGGSFSAGGPGKGMYTRLYTNVLNRHYWIENATAINHAYSDTGLFTFYGNCHPSKLADLVMVLAAEMRAMANPADQTELKRAKRQLQSLLMMNLESRPIIFEDIGRQVLASGERKHPLHFYDKIEQIESADIERVASRLLKSKVSLAALGSLDRLPDVDKVQDMLSNGRSFGGRRLFGFS